MATYYDSTRDVTAQRKTLLHAVRVLTNHGHHGLAQQLWDAAGGLRQ